MGIRNSARLLAILTVGMCISACATVQTEPLNTPSGKSEVTLTAEHERATVAYIMNDALNRGYTIRKQTDSMIMMERPITEVMYRVLFGSRYNSTPNPRVIFNIINNGDRTRIVGDIAIVTNPGSGYEYSNQITTGLAVQQTQDVLNTAAAMR